jgi:Tol biopolymer transport system component
MVAAPTAQAIYPGDNGLIVFAASTTDGVQLFTIRPDGTDVRQITHIDPRPGADNPGASNPDWSPDGRTILFDENDCQIALIDPDGSNLREVPAEPGHNVGVDYCENNPTFSPDGGSIVYERFDGKSDATWIEKVDGSDKEVLTGTCPAGGRISPDGTQISCGGPDGAIWVVQLDGSGAMPITPAGWGIGVRHDWAPDGSAILFTTRPTPDDPANIATVAPDATGQRWLTQVDPSLGARAGSYSPDGKSIVLRLTKDDTQHALAVMAADGSGLKQLTEYSETWPGLDGVGWNDEHFPAFEWGPAPAD